MRSIDSPEPLNRRTWIKRFAVGTAIALGAGNTWRGTLLADIAPSVDRSSILPIDLTLYPPLQAGEGSGSIQISLTAPAVSFPPPPITITRVGDTFYAVNSRCTHQGCPVGPYVAAAGGMVCGCHGSVYNADGTVAFPVVQGQGDLEKYNVDWDGGNLLRVEVPELNMRIESITVQSQTPGSMRLLLSFPVSFGFQYRVRRTTDLTGTGQVVSFATTAAGPANQTSITSPFSGRLGLWVDHTGPRGFYSVELVTFQVA